VTGPASLPGAVAPEAARCLHEVLEPYHAVVYVALEAPAAYAEAGLRGQWMGYFASRAAALGPVGAEAVIALFHNFHPRLVRRAIPDAWALSSVDRVLAARDRVADAALRRLCGDALGERAVTEAADLARAAMEAIDPAGRPLGAAHAALPIPEAPHLALWRAASALREHRFDGHVAVLVGEGVDGCEALVLASASGDVIEEAIRPLRGWPDEDWSAARERLRHRGILDATGRPTRAGRRLKQAIEHRTDLCAAPPFAAVGEAGRRRLGALMQPLVDRIRAGGGIPAFVRSPGTRGGA
jgi:hypothetical protein